MNSKISFQDIIAWLFILLWGYTGLDKLFNYSETVVQLSKSPMIGSMAPIMGIALPVIELALVVLLLLDMTKPLALYLSISLIVAFTTYLIILTRFSYYIPCACGGIFGKGFIINGKVFLKLDWQQHIYFNLVFVFLGLLYILLPVKSSAQTSLPKMELA